MSMNMSELAPGASGYISLLRIQGRQRHRLMELGFLPGAEVKMLFAAASGDPIAYQVRGSVIALRGNDAAKIDLAEKRGG